MICYDQNHGKSPSHPWASHAAHDTRRSRSAPAPRSPPPPLKAPGTDDSTPGGRDVPGGGQLTFLETEGKIDG